MRKKLTLSATLACLLIIFLLSAQPAPLSAGFSRQITVVGITMGEKLGVVAAGTAEDSSKINVLDNQFRQSAHSIAFFALALTLGLCLKHFGLKPFSGLLLTLILCMVLAGLDEYHQTFVPGRGMEWRDFKSDCQGIGVGLLLVGLSYGLLHRLD